MRFVWLKSGWSENAFSRSVLNRALNGNAGRDIIFLYPDMRAAETGQQLFLETFFFSFRDTFIENGEKLKFA